MKAINIRIFIAATAALLLGACMEKNLETSTSPDSNCMGVYFVEDQKNIKDHTFEKGKSEASLSFTVRRTNTEESVEVPYEYNVFKIVQNMDPADTAYVEEPVYGSSRFKFGKLQFAKGQREALVTVSFDGIPVGEKYTCELTISDPKYIDIYGYACTSISFSVQMFEWTKLKGKAIYRDDFITHMFQTESGYPETEVDIYERKDMKGFYRLDNVYSAQYLARLMEGEENYQKDKEALEARYAPYVDESAQLFINASDPKKVYIPKQNIGLSPNFAGSEIYIASDVEENFPGESNQLYGTLSEDLVITFPKQGILFGGGGYYYFSNPDGKMRIVLPGGKTEDYGIELHADDVAADGTTPVTFKASRDVETIKYKVFRGVINEVGIADSLKLTESLGNTITVAEQKSILKSIKPEDADAPTSIYTLVACSYGAGDQTYREYATVEFGYIKPGDKMDVEIYMGLHTDDQYASENPLEDISSANSFQYWVRGKDITSALIGYYPTSYYNTYKESIEESMIKGSSLNAQGLKILNSTGISGILGNLEPCTSYTFIVYAGNGFTKQFFYKTISTQGKPKPEQKTYYYDDIRNYTQPEISRFEGQWIAASYDILSPTATERTIRGNWRAQEVSLSLEGEKMKISGLFPSLNTNPDIRFTIKDGLLYSQENRGARVTIKDSTHIIPTMRFEYQYYPITGAISSSNYFYEKFDEGTEKDRTDMLAAGFVHPDIIAFVDNKTKDHKFFALVMGGFMKDNMGEEYLSDIIGDGHGQLILIRKGSELLENLKTHESFPVQPTTSLSTLKETSVYRAPKFGVLNPEIKEIEIKVPGKVEFRNDLQIKVK